ncbi:hypothetical protein SSP531S_41930 [Streptomyces spongiicola]|uniref:HTH gntR-type domain-containing protein n=1 Tax=Streptomyces spongiicola TaxID=1690221 RepID=A0A388T1S6_9ACTN|nr:hypothetical protein SSP531S_41930 [Streptomyces spongiicola]
MIQRWGVARDTARREVRHLRELGCVHTVPQRGTYVRDRSGVSAGDSTRPRMSATGETRTGEADGEPA